MKKKLIIGLLASLACVSCLTACSTVDWLLKPIDPPASESTTAPGESTPGESTPGESSPGETSTIDLEGAKAYADEMFRASNSSVRKDYELPNTLSYDVDVYPLTWTVNVPTGVRVDRQEDKTIIDVDETLSEELEYTLTLTISNPNDPTQTVSITFNRKVEAAPAKVPAKITKAPVEGTAYKYHIYHAQLQSDNYLTGDIYKDYEYYLAITTEYDKAIDIYVEAVEGEEGKFYMYHNGTTALPGKHYINARKTSDNQHISNYYETTAETKWVFDEEIGTMVTTINDLEGKDTKFFLGCDTDPSHKSVSPQSDANANKGYLIEMVDRTTVADADKIEQTKKELSLAAVYAGNGELDLATMGITFPDASITWTVSENTIASVEDDKLVIATAPTATTTLTLTATISCGEATAATKEFTLKVIPTDAVSIIDALFALESGESFANEVTLTGVVSEFMKDGAYNAQYGNISVNMMVAYDETYKTIGAFRLKSDGTSGIAESSVGVGYTLTVTGILTNYNGSYQFDQGCEYGACVAGTEADVPTVEVEKLDTPQKIMDAAYALATDTALDGTYSLTGTITEIDEAYNSQYGNICVIIEVEGVTGENTTILCYRMKGTGADTLKVGDNITVTGKIKNYSGTVEFDSGCTFVLNSAGSGETGGETTETKVPVAITAAPVVGTAYKYHMVQGNLDNKSLYLNGEMDGFYYATTENVADAIDVFVVATDGGFHMYFVKDGANQYFNIVKSGSYTNVKYEETASSVWTFNTTLGTMTTVCEGTEYFLGTRNDKDFVTFSACDIKYVDNFKGCLSTLENASSNPGEVPPPPAGGEDTPAANEIVLDFAANFATYGAEWGSSYTKHEISFADVGIDGDGKVILSNANKQGKDQQITDKPVICAKNTPQYVTIDLGTSGKNIQSVTFDLQQWGTKTFKDIHIEYSVDGGTTWVACSETITTPATLSSNVAIPEGAMVRLSFVASGTKNTQIGLSKITLTVAD